MKTWGEHGIVSLMESACGALWVLGCSLATAGYWRLCPVFRCCRFLLSHINYGIKNSNPQAFEASGHFSRLHFWRRPTISLPHTHTHTAHRTQCIQLQNLKDSKQSFHSALEACNFFFFSPFLLMMIFVWHFIATKTLRIIASSLSTWLNLCTI